MLSSVGMRPREAAFSQRLGVSSSLTSRELHCGEQTRQAGQVWSSGMVLPRGGPNLPNSSAGAGCETRVSEHQCACLGREHTWRGPPRAVAPYAGSCGSEHRLPLLPLVLPWSGGGENACWRLFCPHRGQISEACTEASCEPHPHAHSTLPSLPSESPPRMNPACYQALSWGMACWSHLLK